MSPRVALGLIPLAFVLASCGGSGGSSTPSRPATPKHTTTPAPPSGSGLSVGATDLRLGGAVAIGPGGTRLLARPSAPNPDRLKAAAAHRAGVSAGDACPDQDLAPTADDMDRVTASTLCLLNGQRADAGLPALTVDSQLSSAAMAHSLDMVAKGYFDHQAPDGSAPLDRIKAAGYLKQADAGWTVGENLAYGSGDAATPAVIVQAWMHSPGHRANILNNRYTQIGMGIVPGDPDKDADGATYTTTFGAIFTPSTAADAGSDSSAAGDAAPASARAASTAAARPAKLHKSCSTRVFHKGRRTTRVTKCRMTRAKARARR